MEKEKQRKCWNCKHRTPAFKIRKLTHYHCMSPTYQQQHESGNSPSPWETLRVFSNSCNEHEFMCTSEQIIEEINELKQ